MESFGQFLVRRGVLSQEDLEEAVASMVLTGGRLGTNLLESGVLGLEELDRELASHLGVPAPPPEWLAGPCREAFAAVPAEMLKRRAILPLAIEKRTLHLALSDPRDAGVVDEVAFAAGLGVRPYVLSEVHLSILRERLLEIPRQRRLAHIDEDEICESKRPTPRPNGKGGPTPEDERAHRQREQLGITPLTDDEELMDAGTFSSMHSRFEEGVPTLAERAFAEAPPEPHRPFEAEPLAPGEVADLERQLAEASDREAIGDCALRLARTHALTSAIFVVQRDAIRGWCAAGTDLGDRIGGVFLPLGSPSVLTATVARGERFRGAPPSGGLDAQLFRALGREDVHEVAIFPVRISGRVVNLLYVDNGPDALGETSLAALEALCGAVSSAYQTLILARRKSYC